MYVIDLDNTLVDLSRPVARMFGRHDLAADPSFPHTYDWADDIGITNRELWARADAQGPRWWAELPWTLWGQRLLRTLYNTGEDVIVATVVVGPNAAAGKQAWAKDNLPAGVPFVMTDSIKWPLSAPGRVLIDDSPGNCESWECYGGSAILVPQPYNANRTFIGSEYEFITKELWALNLLSE